jgi:hypothetical protein
MERETGIEPATSSLGSWRSTAELLPLRPVNEVSLSLQRDAHNQSWSSSSDEIGVNSRPRKNLWFGHVIQGFSWRTFTLT